MTSLWGSKKNGEQDPETNGEALHDDDMPRQAERREPTERDRLLPANPRPPHADGYLDPDDPAVCLPPR